MTPSEHNVEDRFPGWTDGKKYLIVDASYKYADNFTAGADAVGGVGDLQGWLRCFPHKTGTIYCATSMSLFKLWKCMVPHLDLRHAYTESK